MKNKILIFVILTVLTINFTGCDKKSKENNNFSSTGQSKQLKENESKTTQKDLNSKKDNNNKFFFKDISLKNQYTYKGTVWGDNILGKSNENVDSEGGVYVKVNLTVSQIAKLSKGNIYELDFSVKGEKSNTKEKDEKLYWWVTEDKIFDLSPQSNTIDNDLSENGQFNYLKYAKEIEKSGQLPSDDKDEVLCSNDDMNFNKGAWKTTITVKNNLCIYSSDNNGDSSYAKFVWESDKGLINYSWGQGARKSGMDLHLVE